MYPPSAGICSLESEEAWRGGRYLLRTMFLIYSSHPPQWKVRLQGLRASMSTHLRLTSRKGSKGLCVGGGHCNRKELTLGDAPFPPQGQSTGVPTELAFPGFRPHGSEAARAAQQRKPRDS